MVFFSGKLSWNPLELDGLIEIQEEYQIAAHASLKPGLKSTLPPSKTGHI